MGLFYGYARVSTEEQSDYSIEHQLKALSTHCEALSPSMTFQAHSEKISGKNSKRPELQRVLDLLEEGDVFGVYDVSRFGRNTVENLKVAYEIAQKGARLHVEGKLLDLNNPNDVLMLTVGSAVSTYHRDNQNLNSRIGIKTKKEKGEWIFRGDLLGYDVMWKSSVPIVEINEREAEIVKFLFDEYEKTKSINQITKEINRLGWRTRRGKTFNPASVRRYILKPIYMGYYQLEGAGARKGQDKVEVREENLVKSNYYPPIVSEEQWWRVHNSYKGIPRKHAKQFEYRWSYYPLSGIIRCGYCGSGYVHNYKKQGKRYAKPYYANRLHKENCRSKEEGLSFYSTRAEVLEPLFETILYSIFMWDQEVYAYLEEQAKEIRQRVSDVDQQIADVSSAINEKKRKIGNLYRAIEDGINYDRTVKRIQTIEKEIETLEESKAHLRSSVIDEEEELKEARRQFQNSVLEEFVTGTNQQKRDIYNRFFASVGVFNWGIEVRLIYPITYQIIPMPHSGRGNIGGRFQIRIKRDGVPEDTNFYFEVGKGVSIQSLDEYFQLREMLRQYDANENAIDDLDELTGEDWNHIKSAYDKIEQKADDHMRRYIRLLEIVAKVSELREGETSHS